MRGTLTKLALMVGTASLLVVTTAPTYAQRQQPRREPPAATARARAPAAAPTQQSQPQQSTNGMPGYSARPTGMCWERTGGGGQDLSSGYWTQCSSRSGAR